MEKNQNKNKKEAETKNEIEVEDHKSLDFQDTMKDLIEISKNNQKDIKYIKKFIIWSQVWGVLKILIIVVPIIIGFIYLPSFLENWFDSYQEILPQPNLIRNL